MVGLCWDCSFSAYRREKYETETGNETKIGIHRPAFKKIEGVYFG